MDAAVDLSLALVPSAARRATDAASELADRVRLVLETQPGTLPWEPGFGCDLDDLVGGAASSTRIAEARVRIAAALQRWIPGIEVASCKVTLVEAASPDPSDRTVPVAERALASGGVSVVLQIKVVVETPDGPLAVQAELTP